MRCRMCELIKNPDTLVHFDDDNILIIDEPNNGRYKERLLCLWKNHKDSLSPEELSIFLATCWDIKENLRGVWDIVISLRTQKQHFHVHLGRFE